MKVLAIGAHPDDIEFGCGGTIVLYSKNRHQSYFLVLTNGEKGGDPKIRKKEAIKSSKILGAKNIFFGNLPDTQVNYDISTIKVIEKVINKIKPDIVLTTSAKENHQDHHNTSLSTFAAARYVPTLLSYELPSTRQNFLAEYYIDISKSITLKMKALKEYNSQIHKLYFSPDAILGLAKFRGNQIKTKFAEAFEVIWMTGKI